MFKSLYRNYDHPDHKLSEAVLNWKGVILMLFIFVVMQVAATPISRGVDLLNAQYGMNLDDIDLNLIVEGATLALMLLFFARFYWTNLVNFFRDFKPVYLLAPVAGYACALVGNMLANMLLTFLRGSADQTSNNALVIKFFFQRPFVMILLAVVLAPIVEESVFRAALCRPLTVKKNAFAKIFGIVLSVFLFSLMHVWRFAFFATDATGAIFLTFNLDEFLSILMYLSMAINFAVCATLCKNFWSSVIAHMITNGMSMGFLMLLYLLKDYILQS